MFMFHGFLLGPRHDEDLFRAMQFALIDVHQTRFTRLIIFDKFIDFVTHNLPYFISKRIDVKYDARKLESINHDKWLVDLEQIEGSEYVMNHEIYIIDCWYTITLELEPSHSPSKSCRVQVV